VSGHPDRLLWYAAGSLDPAESAEIERHLRECADCRGEVEAVRSLARTLRADPERAHVPADRLVAWQDARSGLSPAERAGIGDHLRRCPSCASDLDALRRANGVERRPQLRWALPAAASLVLVLAAGWQLGGRRGDPARPARDTRPIVLVLPPGQRGGSLLPAIPAVPAVPAGRALRVEALLPLHADQAAYRLRIRRADATAKVELETVVARVPGEEVVRLSVPGGLRPGHHELAFVEAAGERREIDVRGFDVIPP
jgi:anti-sigma factor ChrR (cupin superfamily)